MCVIRDSGRRFWPIPLLGFQKVRDSAPGFVKKYSSISYLISIYMILNLYIYRIYQPRLLFIDFINSTHSLEMVSVNPLENIKVKRDLHSYMTDIRKLIASPQLLPLSSF